MKTVLYIQTSGERPSIQLKFAGAQRRLKAAGYHLHKIMADGCNLREIEQLTAFWEARGLIVDCRGQRPTVSGRLRDKTPIVYLDIARSFESVKQDSVSYDIRKTCYLAAREVLSLDCAAYGYAGYGSETPWSEERKRIFAQALKLNGHDLETFELNPSSVRPTAFYNRLRRWILRMPKPFGIFAADDSYALHVYSVIQNLKFRIPTEIALLGVDNESPTLGAAGLSSIQLDFQEAGRLAADLLLERIARPHAPPAKRHFGPVQLLRRSSTRKLRIRSGNMTLILEKIRGQIPRSLTAREVASWMPGSRRLAEMSFRKATGRSILKEITATRIERAKELLVNTSHSINEVADLCGYHTFNTFRNAFKKVTGITPRDWRKRTPGTQKGQGLTGSRRLASSDGSTQLD